MRPCPPAFSGLSLPPSLSSLPPSPSSLSSPSLPTSSYSANGVLFSLLFGGHRCGKLSPHSSENDTTAAKEHLASWFQRFPLLLHHELRQLSMSAPRDLHLTRWPASCPLNLTGTFPATARLLGHSSPDLCRWGLHPPTPSLPF